MPSREGPGAFVLLVQENRESGTRLACALRAGGHAVRTVSDGPQALDCLRGEQIPDLILLDHLLPATSCASVRHQQRRDPRLAAVPVVLLSGDENLTQGNGAAGDGDLCEPVASRRLLEVVRRLSRSRRLGVLVVEDEAAVRLLLDRALRQHGFDVTLADRGEDAVQVFDRKRSAIDVVLLDVQLAGMDGPQTLAALRQIDPEVRAVFISDHTGEYTSDQIEALGAHVVEKPFPSLTAFANLLRDLATR
jgi:CheY-like chemotaxis protein